VSVVSSVDAVIFLSESVVIGTDVVIVLSAAVGVDAVVDD